MKVSSRKVHIHVEERGNGSPSLIFLHYWGGSSRTWNYVIDALPGVYRTLAMDLRGWGASDRPDEGYALADFADDVQHVITASGSSNFVLVGHSMGGKIAQLIASRKPKGWPGWCSSPLRLRPRWGCLPRCAKAWKAPIRLRLRSPQRSTKCSRRSRSPRTSASRSSRIACVAGAAAKIAWPRYTSQEDISAVVSAITVPTLVIAGELDRVDTVSTLETELLARIPHAVMHVLPGTGHLSPLESPRDVAELIGQFLSSLASGAHSA